MINVEGWPFKLSVAPPFDNFYFFDYRQKPTGDDPSPASRSQSSYMAVSKEEEFPCDAFSPV